MASLFMAEVLDMAASVGEVMSEPFTLLPRIKGADRNAPDIPDPARAQATFNGVFLDPPMKPAIMRAYDARTDQRPGTNASEPRIDIMPDQLVPGFAVQAPDLIVSQSSGKTWRVTHVTPTKAAILRCFVNLVG
ncbi:conserved hypothetical protein [Methylocella tundrae]|uniref:Uncharacterized protein n=1 Tax=Methylocella tundrae TaxID=227605 RepID=A0A8B6MD79_METTU|nr:hypothetical protein [Methylocella tundrae]VTZ27902.1 conserved hypothetical protein [Methylocella tundrae]VTZ52488.1 conserved hypothetical protein [Methylocella tundrae]